MTSLPDFTEQPKVANGVSDLMVEEFGDAGRHARSAVAANVLPLNVAVDAGAKLGDDIARPRGVFRRFRAHRRRVRTHRGL